MQKLIALLSATLLVVVVGCSAPTGGNQEDSNAEGEMHSEDEMQSDEADEEEMEESMEGEEMDPIDAAIESGDPAECEALGEAWLVEACLQEQGN